jgi:uncharacterized protein YdhG (YjbR/CyaY superfamily)
MAKASTFDEYLDQIDAEERAALERVRVIVSSAMPDAVETISYQMPTFKYKGKALLGIAAFKEHCSLFPYSTGVMSTLEKDLEPYDTSGNGATIRFTTSKPLPKTLIKKVVKVRKQEIDAGKR